MILPFKSQVELSSNHHCTYFTPITTSAIIIKVPIKLVAHKTISCNNNVGFMQGDFIEINGLIYFISKIRWFGFILMKIENTKRYKKYIK